MGTCDPVAHYGLSGSCRPVGGTCRALCTSRPSWRGGHSHRPRESAFLCVLSVCDGKIRFLVSVLCGWCICRSPAARRRRPGSVCATPCCCLRSINTWSTTHYASDSLTPRRASCTQLAAELQRVRQLESGSSSSSSSQCGSVLHDSTSSSHEQPLEERATASSYDALLRLTTKSNALSEARSTQCLEVSLRQGPHAAKHAGLLPSTAAARMFLGCRILNHGAGAAAGTLTAASPPATAPKPALSSQCAIWQGYRCAGVTGGGKAWTLRAAAQSRFPCGATTLALGLLAGAAPAAPTDCSHRASACARDEGDQSVGRRRRRQPGGTRGWTNRSVANLERCLADGWPSCCS